jgi:hypothetical protein
MTTPAEWLASDEGKRYAFFVRQLRKAVIDFGTYKYKGKENNPSKIIRSDVPLVDANSVGSECFQSGDNINHKPVLDIDVPIMAVPSSTPGHSHLYINKPMTWEDYAMLLKVLAAVGILEPGYVDACMIRKCSWVRTPWTKK